VVGTIPRVVGHRLQSMHSGIYGSKIYSRVFIVLTANFICLNDFCYLLLRMSLLIFMWFRSLVLHTSCCSIIPPYSAHHISLLITSHFLSPLTSCHLSPLITSHFLSPLTSYHPSPLITFHFLSPLTSYHPSPLITSHYIFLPLLLSTGKACFRTA
jgi:hypothetical protein